MLLHKHSCSFQTNYEVQKVSFQRKSSHYKHKVEIYFIKTISLNLHEPFASGLFLYFRYWTLFNMTI